MRIAFTGDRHWSTEYYEILADLFEFYITEKDEIRVGCADGVDSIVRDLAYPPQLCVYKAKWDLYGRAAGPIRNREMLTIPRNVELLIAVHKDLSKSKGTKNCINQAEENGIEVKFLL